MFPRFYHSFSFTGKKSKADLNSLLKIDDIHISQPFEEEEKIRDSRETSS